MYGTALQPLTGQNSIKSLQTEAKKQFGSRNIKTVGLMTVGFPSENIGRLF